MTDVSDVSVSQRATDNPQKMALQFGKSKREASPAKSNDSDNCPEVKGPDLVKLSSVESD